MTSDEAITAVSEGGMQSKPVETDLEVAGLTTGNVGTHDSPRVLRKYLVLNMLRKRSHPFNVALAMHQIISL